MMKTILVSFTFSTVLVINAFAQKNEFTVYPNGLIYNEQTMNKLGHIVDSLNLKFRLCELTREYSSKYQAVANYIQLDNGNAHEALKDIEKNISYRDFKRKYPRATIEENILVVKYKYTDYRDKVIVLFRGEALENSRVDIKLSFQDQPWLYDTNVINCWIHDYYKGSEYSGKQLRAFYFPENFKLQALPEQYARMVQYSDCMVDTNTTVYFNNAERTGGWYNENKNSKVEKALDYARKKTNEKDYNEDKADTGLLNDDHFKTLLRDAVDEALKNGGSTGKFEFYVGNYLSKEDELKLKRSRIVVGGCSMDQAPRYHALNIALLSAETINWEVFLRAHLDIMNDRFERASDGSYAWGRRQTYISELEDLDINVTDLLLGICLRVENPSQNHYYGDIGRLGRGLSETKNRVEVEGKILQMIANNGLDDYNRLLMYYLFLNYNYYIQDEKVKEQNIVRLKEAVAKLPTYLSERIEFEK